MFKERTLENHELLALIGMVELKTVNAFPSLEAKGLIACVDGTYRLTDKGRFHFHKLTHLYIQEMDEM